MKFLVLLVFSVLSMSVLSQYDLEEIEEPELEEDIEEEPILDINTWYGPIETKPYLKECEADSTQDLQKCTEKKIFKFIEENIKIPEGKGCVQGTVFVQFVINKIGGIEDVQVLKGFHKSADAAAIEVIKKLPLFVPGTQRGRPVKVKYTIPVRFKSY